MAAAKANLLGKREAEDDLETKPILKKHKETTEEFADSLQGKVELKEVAVRKKTLFVGHISPQTKISDVINFFKDVGEVFRVLLILDNKGKHVGYGFVEFASSNDAKKALEKNGEILLGHKIALVWAKQSPLQHKYCIDHKLCYVGEVVSVRLIVNPRGKHVGYGFVEFASPNEAKEALKMNGEYLHDHKIFLQVAAKIAPKSPRHKYSLAEMLCYDEDYLRSERLLILEDHIVERDEPSGYAEVVAARKNTLRVANLSLRTKISDIINFFKDVGDVVHVRVIVNHRARHVGYGFVEFASAYEAEKALKKNGETLLGREIYLHMAEITSHPPPKYCIDHKVWYERYLRENTEEDEGRDEPPEFAEEVSAAKKTLFVDNLSPETDISKINKFFKNAGEVVSVRLIVDDEGNHVGCAFVEFASPNEAKMVRQKKIFLDVAKLAPYPPRHRYSLAEMTWYEGYLRQESLRIEEILRIQKDDLEATKRVEFCGKKITFSDDD